MPRVQLDDLFRRYPDWPLMREAARDWLRRLTRNRAAGQALTGAYYWVPVPSRQGFRWVVKEFFDGWRPSSDHQYVWRHVRDFLESKWRCSLGHIGYCSLPRGRVCRSWIGPVGKARATWVVLYHGNDSPGDLTCVRKKFNLQPHELAAFDIHEQCLPHESQQLAHALGIDLQSRQAQE